MIAMIVSLRGCVRGGPDGQLIAKPIGWPEASLPS
jgi:hypothetical protein